MEGGAREREKDPNELFRRVWARVMPEDRVDCPFVVLPPGGEGAEEGRAAVPALPEAGAQGTLLALLWELAEAKTALCRGYARLAGRSARGKALAALSAEERVHVRRLEALCFLLSGEGAPRSPAGAAPPLTGLGELFREEGRCLRLLAAAEEAAENDLRELLAALAREEGRHRRTLMRLAEGR